MQYYTCDLRPEKSQFLTNTGSETIVEKQGYIPKEVQIKRLEIAGIKLDLYRKSFDFQEEVENMEYFVNTYKESQDMADISQQMNYLRNKGVIDELGRVVLHPKEDVVEAEPEAAKAEAGGSVAP